MFGKGVTLNGLAQHRRLESNLVENEDERSTIGLKLDVRAGLLLAVQEPCNVGGVPSPRAVVFRPKRPHSGQYQCDGERRGTASDYTGAHDAISVHVAIDYLRGVVDLVARVTLDGTMHIHLAGEGDAHGSQQATNEFKCRLRFQAGACRILPRRAKTHARQIVTLPSGLRHDLRGPAGCQHARQLLR
ncbi:MAG: hypothetical protein U1F37_08660 [Alphaproteobacteria bacterium]